MASRDSGKVKRGFENACLVVGAILCVPVLIVAVAIVLAARFFKVPE